MVDIIGTPGNDTLTGSNLDFIYGLAGDDLLSLSEDITSNSLENIALSGQINTQITPQSFLFGGSGSDTYLSRNNVQTFVLENGNSSSDTLVTESITLSDPNSVFFEFDNRHLVMQNNLTGESLLLIDWQNPENRIENFTSMTNAESVISYEDLVSNLTSNGNYFGNISIEQVFEIFNLPITADEFNADINALFLRAEVLEAFEV